MVVKCSLCYCPVIPGRTADLGGNPLDRPPLRATIALVFEDDPNRPFTYLW